MNKESTVNSNNQSKIETVHASIDPEATEEGLVIGDIKS